MDRMDWRRLTPEQWRELLAEWDGAMMTDVCEVEWALKQQGQRRVAHAVFDRALAVDLHLRALVRQTGRTGQTGQTRRDGE